jgi:hypothetical protein
MSKILYQVQDALEENVNVRRTFLFFYFVYANEKRFGPFLTFNRAKSFAKHLAGKEGKI